MITITFMGQYTDQDLVYFRTEIEKKVRLIIPDVRLKNKKDATNNLATKLGKLNRFLTMDEHQASRAFLNIANELSHGHSPIQNEIEEQEYVRNCEVLHAALDRIIAEKSTSAFTDDYTRPDDSNARTEPPSEKQPKKKTSLVVKVLIFIFLGLWILGALRGMRRGSLSWGTIQSENSVPIPRSR